MAQVRQPALTASGADVSEQWHQILREAWQRGTHGGFQAVYRAYTQSKPYRALKRALKREVGNVCQQCGQERAALQMHHLHYLTVGKERLHDVRLLCQDCHTAIAHGGLRVGIPPCPAQRESARQAYAEQSAPSPAPKRGVRRRPRETL